MSKADFYTEEELDRGIGMGFHPLCGTELRRLSYELDRRQFRTTVHFGGWSMEGKTVWYDRISGGSSWRVGEPYPSHWKFHPLTGKPLKGSNAMAEQIASYTSEQIDEGKFGVDFHPVTGESLAGLQYDRARRLFYGPDHRPEQGVGWGVTVKLKRKRGYRVRIGDGTDRSTGNLFHKHWRFDPFTGKALEAATVKPLWEQD